MNEFITEFWFMFKQRYMYIIILMIPTLFCFFWFILSWRNRTKNSTLLTIISMILSFSLILVLCFIMLIALYLGYNS
ncbi:hypothetical protein FM106_01155 [Brachybacterium faecium]|nr:hypothetical protein FM106_01155 [Brachybacterium faecium]